MTPTRRPSPFGELLTLRLSIPMAEQVMPRPIWIRPVTAGGTSAVETGSAPDAPGQAAADTPGT